MAVVKGVFQVRRALLLLVAVSVLAVGSVAVAWAGSGLTYVYDDFDEDNWTLSNGYAIFKDDSMQLIPSASSNTGEIEYKTKFADMEGGNSTALTHAYLYFKCSYVWSQTIDSLWTWKVVSTAPKTTEIHLLNSSQCKFQCKYDTLEPVSVNIDAVPTEGIIGYDGDWCILYDADGDVLASIEMNNGTFTFDKFGFKNYKTNYITWTTFAITDNLHDAMFRSSQMSITSWLPTIVSLAMLSMCIGFVKKFAR